MKGQLPSIPPDDDACWEANGGPLTKGIWNLLVRCWNMNPVNRPGAEEIYHSMHLRDIEDTRSPDNWPLPDRFNDLYHSAQFITPKVIEDTFKLLKEAESDKNQQ
ncbi:hypothetical protein BDQ17DRAFT_1438208 [Cyathus striatus]|nr:hypothetical protein BDQ17DRAFT_1438208 [Cyathus striatus]